MKLSALLVTLASLGISAPAWADHEWPTHHHQYHEWAPHAPEISSNGSLAAIMVVVALGMILWERRRRA